MVGALDNPRRFGCSAGTARCASAETRAGVGASAGEVAADACATAGATEGAADLRAALGALFGGSLCRAVGAPGLDGGGAGGCFEAAGASGALEEGSAGGREA
jgi:hypothetical protein